MTLATLLVLAVGLSLDAMAVAAARGLTARHVRARDVAWIAGLFGGFQAGMPVLGWLVGRRVGAALAAWDHWIVFVLLVGLGAKMLREAAHGGPEGAPPAEAFEPRLLLGLAVATSVDALAVGLTLPMLGASIGRAALVIGTTTALLSAIGVLLGRRLGALAGRRLDALGGLVLVGLGVKILAEHLAG